MAEFCTECWNELNDTNHSDKHFILSKDLELCEGCGEYKRVIIAERINVFLFIFLLPFLPIFLVFKLIDIICFRIENRNILKKYKSKKNYYSSKK